MFVLIVLVALGIWGIGEAVIGILWGVIALLGMLAPKRRDRGDELIDRINEQAARDDRDRWRS